MTWTRGTVISHVQHHQDTDAKGSNPPWTRMVRCDDGTVHSFDWRHLCRNCTYSTNTDVGSEVWVSDEGGISAPKPHDAI